MTNRVDSPPVFGRLPYGSRRDPGFGQIYDDAPANADDLTRIRGIHAREAVSLNQLGVHFIAQIATWQHREVCAFADALGVSPARLLDEEWVEQARHLCHLAPTAGAGTHHMPASLIRTCSLLVCALLVGCMIVYWLGMQQGDPLHGVLSAEITSLKVPAEARLVAAHVEVGSEVFTGEQLLTLEKTEHVTLVAAQEQLVRRLQQQLQQAEAQAALDLEWRMRDLEREMSEVRSRAQLIQEVKRQTAEPLRTAADSTQAPRNDTVQTAMAVPVSHTREVPATSSPRVNGMLFVSGLTGKSTADFAEPLVIPEDPAEDLRIPPVTASVAADFSPQPELSETAGLLQLETRNAELRLEQLQQLKDKLPTQVRQAAGVDTLQQQHAEAAARLTEMSDLSHEVSVVCPVYGRVGEILFREGETLPAGEVMLKILHTDRRFVEVQVPTRRLNELQAGADVQLVFPGGEHYSGTVAELPLLAAAGSGTASGTGDNTATVRVRPAGRLWPLVPVGTHIDVVLKD